MQKTRDIRCRKNETFHRPNEDTRPDNCLPREGSPPASARFNKASDQVSLYVEGEAKTSRPWPQFAVQSLSEIKATGRIHKNSSSPYTFCKVHLSASSTLLLQPGGDVYVDRPTLDRLTEPPPNDHKISYKNPPLYAKLQSRRPDDYYLHSALNWIQPKVRRKNYRIFAKVWSLSELPPEVLSSYLFPHSIAIPPAKKLVGAKKSFTKGVDRTTTTDGQAKYTLIMLASRGEGKKFERVSGGLLDRFFVPSSPHPKERFIQVVVVRTRSIKF